MQNGVQFYSRIVQILLDTRHYVMGDKHTIAYLFIKI